MRDFGVSECVHFIVSDNLQWSGIHVQLSTTVDTPTAQCYTNKTRCTRTKHDAAERLEAKAVWPFINTYEYR